MSPDLANDIVAKALTGEVVSRPLDALYAYDLAVEDMTTDEVRASFAADWSGKVPLLVMTGPKPAPREACWPPGRRAPARRCRRATPIAPPWPGATPTSASPRR